ncbi:MAG: TlpA family protein disulfide reductase [Burkholderiales bacterium]|nr:MAG: TlpA family protein disulfide reductase [Burkholderiales bacterium]
MSSLPVLAAWPAVLRAQAAGAASDARQGTGAAAAPGSTGGAAPAAGGGTGRVPRWPERASPELGARIEIPRSRLIDGSVLEPAYWADKVLVVELWATWCPFCARQNPHVDKLHREGTPRGLEVLGLALDRSPTDVARYMRQHGYGFHAALFDEEWLRAIGRPRGLPVVWVIGRDRLLKQLETREMFPEDVEELLRWA